MTTSEYTFDDETIDFYGSKLGYVEPYALDEAPRGKVVFTYEHANFSDFDHGTWVSKVYTNPTLDNLKEVVDAVIAQIGKTDHVFLEGFTPRPKYPHKQSNIEYYELRFGS
jgi:hypothetical protein